MEWDYQFFCLVFLSFVALGEAGRGEGKPQDGRAGAGCGVPQPCRVPPVPPAPRGCPGLGTAGGSVGAWCSCGAAGGISPAIHN